MNYKHLTVFALAAALTLGSCNEKKQDTAKHSLPQGATEKAMTIRYVDGDTIMEKYNLAKDLNESMLRRQNQLDAAQQQRSTEINKFGSTMQQKYKNNQYLTQESFNSDQAKLQKMQSDAQTYLGKMQQSIQSEYAQNSRQLQDSISNYLKVYAKEKGYDMVLLKSATLYADPKFDVTSEVVEGLNKRYNKVSKK